MSGSIQRLGSESFSFQLDGSSMHSTENMGACQNYRFSLATNYLAIPYEKFCRCQSPSSNLHKNKFHSQLLEGLSSQFKKAVYNASNNRVYKTS